MSKPHRFAREMQEQGLTIRRRFVASVNDGDLEHSQNDDDGLCGFYVKNAAGKTATVVWHVTGPLSELFIIAEDSLLETNIVDAFVSAFGDIDED